jgi:iron complex outermembrane receptor protein
MPLPCLILKKVLNPFTAFMIIASVLNFKAGIIAQEKNYELNEIVVTASKSPITISNLTRDVIVIDNNEIKTLPVSNVQDLLQYTGGVDLRQRGINGVQADVSIRGGNNEETLILIDGIKVIDPQTGHHNLNLPISLDNIQRIEILKGQGSRIFGPNAFSGVINIITKKGSGSSLFVNASGGENNYFEGTAGGSYSLGPLNSYLTFSKIKTDGYRHNTAFDRINFSYNSSIKAGDGRINLLFGYDDNKFGANGFYGVVYPNQWEHTTTKFLNAGAEFGNEIFSFSPKIYWRRNDDNYLLDYQRPSFYQNIHQTNVYGAELQSSINSAAGTTSIGGEFVNDEIRSTNLGTHSRNKKGIYAEQKISPVKNFTIITGAFLYDYSGLGWKFWPGLDLGYSFFENLRIYGSVGKGFRIPTYTELYYSSPISVGNPDLKSEETLNYEAGLNWLNSNYSARISLFRKEGKNLIDWVRTNEGKPWTARNISRINTNGFEIYLSIKPSGFFDYFPIYKISTDYTFLNSDKKNTSYQSEYLLDFLRNQLIVQAENYWWLGIKQSWIFRYEDRINFENHFIVDSQISKEIGNFNLFIKATNLFNKSYQEISGVPLPGRWIITGIKFRMSGE